MTARAIQAGRVVEAFESFLIDDGTRPIARLFVESDCEVSVVTGIYCPEFGKKIESPLLILSSEGLLPLSMSYWVEKI